MAHSTLPSLAHSEFPQVFTEAIDFMVARISAHPQLGDCDYETPEFVCRNRATVHNLATEQEFCAQHFAKVSRG